MPNRVYFKIYGVAVMITSQASSNQLTQFCQVLVFNANLKLNLGKGIGGSTIVVTHTYIEIVLY